MNNELLRSSSGLMDIRTEAEASRETKESFDKLQTSLIVHEITKQFREDKPEFVEFTTDQLDISEPFKAGVSFDHKAKVVSLSDALWAEIKPMLGEQAGRICRMSCVELYAPRDVGIGAVETSKGLSLRIMKSYQVQSDDNKYRADVSFRFRWEDKTS